MAAAFGIEHWPVAAVKAYLGHTLAPASGDQTALALGTWRYGIIPGIATIKQPAEDVHHDRLRIAPEHLEVGPQAMDIALVNSKGFGGNNATGLLLAPQVARELLATRHGKAALARWARRNEAVAEAADDYDRAATAGAAETIYRYGDGVLDGADLVVTAQSLEAPGYGSAIDLGVANPFA